MSGVPSTRNSSMKRKRSLSPNSAVNDVVDTSSASDLDGNTTNALNDDVGSAISVTTQYSTLGASEHLFNSPPSDAQDEQICERCVSLKLLELFNVNRRKYYKPLVKLGKLDKCLEDSSCPVCRFLYAVRAECAKHKAVTKYALYCADNFDLSYAHLRVTLRVQCDLCSLPDPWKDRKYEIAMQATQEASISFHRQGQVHTIAPDQVSFQTLIRWIERCEEEHSKKCSSHSRTSGYPRNLRLIDCHKRAIVKSQPGTKYAALSYVWGKNSKPDPSQFCSAETLPSLLPQTIEDAIRAVLGLGLDYLWIDRYCIDQINKSEKHFQIRQMNLIYQNAYVTIIAAAGQDASYGLPGISSRPRIVRPSVRLGKVSLVAIPFRSKNIVEKSAWTTRGWTFQEGFFSTRRMIFTDDQIHFECRTSTSQESNPEVAQTWKFFLDNAKKKKDPWDVIKLLASYSTRKLSFHEDAINAFEGVLHDFQGGKDPLIHHFGVLIIPSIFAGRLNGVLKADRTKNERLMAGLCWRSCSEGERRACFPSWSWAGWTCSVEEHHRELAHGLHLSSEEGPKIIMEASDSMRNEFHADDLPMKQWLESIGETLHLELWVISLRLWDTTRFDDELSLLLTHIDKVYAVLENEQYLLRAEIALICQPEELRIERADPLQAFDAKNTFAALFSDGTLDGKYETGNLFFLVIEQNGQTFRRIGHIHVERRNVMVMSKDGIGGKRQIIDWDSIPPDEKRELILQDRRRVGIQLT